MVHELIGIRNNRVDLSRCPGVSKELQVWNFSFINNNNIFYLANVILSRWLTPQIAKKKKS